MRNPSRLIAFLLFLGIAPAWGTSELTTIEAVDLPRYMGRWYEIAKFPNRFQTQCVSDTTATYALLPDNTVRVENRCRLASGQMDEAIGAGRRVGPAPSAKLEVRFAPGWLGWIPYVWGEYWIVDLDPEYQWSVISTSSRKYLWILSRTPTLPAPVYTGIVDRLKAKGFSLEQLTLSPQTGY